MYPHSMMLLVVLLSGSFFGSIYGAKHYIIETKDEATVIPFQDGVTEAGDDYGADWAPKPYGGYTCSYGHWSQWSALTATCGTATKMRTRVCNCSDGVSRTDDCSGSSLETQTVHLKACPTAWKAKTYGK